LESIFDDSDYISDRDTQTSIFQALAILFKSKSLNVRKEFFNVDKPPEETLFWISENLPYVYEPKDVFSAYKYISKSDIFLGRVRRRQYFSLWKYASDLMTGGVSVSRNGNFHFARFQSPSFFIKLARSRGRRNLESRILEKISKKCHCSKKSSREYIHVIKVLDLERVSEICKFFDFDEDEIEFLREDYAKIRKILKQLEERKIEKPKEFPLERRKEKKMVEKEEIEKSQKSLHDF